VRLLLGADQPWGGAPDHRGGRGVDWPEGTLFAVVQASVIEGGLASARNAMFLTAPAAVIRSIGSRKSGRRFSFSCAV
jgi:hypothetical protein